MLSLFFTSTGKVGLFMSYSLNSKSLLLDNFRKVFSFHKREMKRNKKQENRNQHPNMTLLKYFKKISGTTSHTSLPEISPSATSSTSIISSGISKELDSVITKCPGCNLNIPTYKINDHLDFSCSSLKSSCHLQSVSEADTIINVTTKLENQEDDVSISPSERKTIQVSSSSSLKKNITNGAFHHKGSQFQTPYKTLTNQHANSTTKKNDLRRSTLANQFQFSTSQTVPKLSKKDSNNLSQQSSDSIKKQLFPEHQELKRVPYYLDNFCFVIKSTIEDPFHSHLFNEEDRKWVQQFQSSSISAQKLYVRLFTRKFQWRRQEKIKYEEIDCDLTSVLLELCSSSFLLDIDELDELPVLLSMLTQPEIKQLCKDVKLPFNNKGDSVQELLEYCQKQRSVFGSHHSLSAVIIKKVKNILKACYKLNSEPRRVFLRLGMLSSLHQQQEEDDDKGQQQQFLTLLLVNMGRMSFPDYDIRREILVFQDRIQLINYEEAVQLEWHVRESLEKQQFQRVLVLTDEIATKLTEQLNDNRSDLRLPIYLRRFTAGSVHVYCLNKRIEALQRLKLYQQAVDLLNSLIHQDVYLLYYRGHWYERLALNLDQHLKKSQQALDVIANGLNDSWVTPSHKLALSQRAERICCSAKLKKQLGNVLCDLPLISPAKPVSVTISGRSLPRDLPGYKSMFIRGDSEVNTNEGNVTLCSVEELVLEHYKRNGYTHGIHGEGSTITTIVGLIFWDIVYKSDVVDVFFSPYQALPLDFDSIEFYQSRQSFIEDRLQQLKETSTTDIAERVMKVWSENYGKVSLVSWERFPDLECLLGLIHCISPPALACIADRLLINYRHFRSGFPDLTLWNPSEKKWKIVEVKGPNDRLSTKQILWLDFLVSIGIDAEVCYVQAVGAKRMGVVGHSKRISSNQLKDVPLTQEESHTKKMKLDIDVNDDDFQ